MRIGDLMTRDVTTIDPAMSLAVAAKLMAARDLGFLPVLSAADVVGIVTDRDLVVRALAQGLAPTEPVSAVMTPMVHSCYPDDHCEDALGIMADEQLRRLPVCDAHGRLQGIISLVDLAGECRAHTVASTLVEIGRSHGDHCQAVRPRDCKSAVSLEEGLR